MEFEAEARGGVLLELSSARVFNLNSGQQSSIQVPSGVGGSLEERGTLRPPWTSVVILSPSQQLVSRVMK